MGVITSAKDCACKARSSMSQFVSIYTSASPRSTCAGHAVVQAVERLFQRRRNAEKILPTGILSRSIGGVDPGTHEALNNVRAFLSYQHWRVRHRSFPAGYNIRNNCQRPKRVLMPVEASLGIMATFNRIKNVQEKQWVFTIPFRFHTKLWWLRGSRLTSTRYTHTRRDAKERRHRTCGFELAPNCIQAVGHRKSESATPKTEWGGNFSRSILLWFIFG